MMAPASQTKPTTALMFSLATKFEKTSDILGSFNLTNEKYILFVSIHFLFKLPFEFLDSVAHPSGTPWLSFIWIWLVKE